MVQLLPQGNPAFLFLITINKFFECLCHRIGIPALKKYHVLGRNCRLVFFYGKINIVLFCHTLKRLDVAVRDFDRRCPHALANELFHRSFSMRSLCFLLTVVQVHLHRRFQHVGVQFCSFNHKGNRFLCYFLLHEAPPCYVPEKSHALRGNPPADNVIDNLHFKIRHTSPSHLWTSCPEVIIFH